MSDQNIGKFYAVGVGPGDPDLLTRKAYQILSEVEVIWAPIARTSDCLLYTSPSPRDRQKCRMPSSA